MADGQDYGSLVLMIHRDFPLIFPRWPSAARWLSKK